MSRKEPKLRPSMSWAEINLAVTAMDDYIRRAVTSKQVTKQIFDMVLVKEYMEGFKPPVTTDNEEIALIAFMKKYGLSQYSKADTEPSLIPEQPAEVISMESMTDDQRYDYLKLSDESTYTDEDKVFMLNTGTMIMLRRAGMKSVNSEDL
ncbi:hypothetical protein [Edaphovirga cremea]|uniref:hypothetical protein n=1 Tax=Edaphovirga cremea TaxID=2267246 RepID=UPI003988D134